MSGALRASWLRAFAHCQRKRSVFGVGCWPLDHSDKRCSRSSFASDLVFSLEGPMPYAPDHKQQTRKRIVRSAAHLFNRRGFAEVTIGEVMTVAGLTHGGFYRHFSSKDELYAEAVRHFLRKEAPARWQKRPAGARKPDQPFAKSVVDAYLSHEHFKDVDGSCPLIGLSSDVAHSGEAVKVAYREVAE